MKGSAAERSFSRKCVQMLVSRLLRSSPVRATPTRAPTPQSLAQQGGSLRGYSAAAVLGTGATLHVPATAAAVSSDTLKHDASMADLATLCYVRDDGELERRLKEGGLRLLASRRLSFTSYYVAEGASESSGEVPYRFVCIRGVSWSAPDLEAAGVWRSLANVWPVPFLAHLTQRNSELVAHGGVAEMAAQLWEEVHPYVETAGGDIRFAGHSLGGSLAVLLAGMSSLSLGIPGERLRCTTFGSPPVLSRERGTSGEDVPSALGLPLSHMRNLVLDQDPVPRALLAADPAFGAFKGIPVVRTILDLRERIFGDGTMLSRSRFMFHAAGAVFLIRWDAENGYTVRSLSEHDAQQELALDVDGIRAAPLRVAHAILDHHTGSYSSALHSAAASLAKQQL